MTVTKIRTAMYNVGFGDAFLLSLEHGTGTWRMLIDCGVHPGGGSGIPMAKIVDRIISDISPGGAAPHLDVVVATHRHRDHVSGFALDQWDTVTVDEVWMGFTENPDDKLGRSIKRAQASKVERLRLHVAALAAAGDRQAAAAARILENDFTNAPAMTRLHERFAGSPKHRYFPSPDGTQETFTIPGLSDVTVSMLGPRRDTGVMAAMDPPADQQWLRLLNATDTDSDMSDPTSDLFADSFQVPAETIRHEHGPLYLTLRDRAGLHDDISVDALAAAASIANATNNTSLVFVVDVAGTKLLFPGDAQWGLWNAILNDPDAADVMADTRLYKVGHHGSHNGTDKHYAQDLMGDDVTAMMSFHKVKDWPSIPNPNLITALTKRPRVLIRSDQHTRTPNLKRDGDMVAEYTINLT